MHEQQALTKRSPAAQAKTLDRFRRGIEPDWVYGCWVWQEAAPDDEYGRIHVGGGTWLAHRFAYVWFMGGHGRRLTLDHTCNRPRCVRPDHMQPVPGSKNTKRRDERALAPVGTWWDLGQMPTSSTADEWAKANGLPYGNPEWWDALPGKVCE